MSARPFSILAVGEVNIDLILSGIPHIPAFGTEVLAAGISRHLGGCTANFAVCCARLGEGVAFVSHVGRDDFGSFLLSELARHGVPTEHVTVVDSPTGVTVSLSGPQDRAFVTYLGTIDSVVAQDVPDELLAQARHLHVGSYFMQHKLRAGLSGLFERAHRAGLTVSLDTGYDPAERWNGGLQALLATVDVFLPNEIEAMRISGQTDVHAAARRLAERCPLVVVKLGEQGSMAIRRPAGSMACEVLAQPAFTVQVVDTTCCGDAFNAGFLRAWLARRELVECLREGNRAGAIIATGPGNCAERLEQMAGAEHA